jgi:hypothetical protein
MMSSTMWACLALLPATLHLISGTTCYRCITRPVVVPDSGPRCWRWSAVAPYLPT